MRLRLLLPAVCLILAVATVMTQRVSGQRYRRFGTVVVTMGDDDSFFNSYPNRISMDGWHFFDVYLVRGATKHKMHFDERRQRFTLRVPQGVYDVVIDPSSGEYRRSNILVRGARTSRLFVHVFDSAGTVCVEHEGFAALPTDVRTIDVPEARYDSFDLAPPLRMLVKYCEKKIIGDTIEYKFISLTYKNLTLHARAATLDTKSFVLHATGDAQSWISVDNKTCIKRAEKISVNLQDNALNDFSCRDVIRH